MTSPLARANLCECPNDGPQMIDASSRLPNHQFANNPEPDIRDQGFRSCDDGTLREVEFPFEDIHRSYSVAEKLADGLNSGVSFFLEVNVMTRQPLDEVNEAADAEIARLMNAAIRNHLSKAAESLSGVCGDVR